MQKVLLPQYDHDPAEKLRIMRDNYESSVETYYRKLAPDEIAAREQELSKDSIEIYKLEKRLKEIKLEFKEQIDPLKVNKDRLMIEIDTGQVEHKGELFYNPDYDNGLMITYDSEGKFVSERFLKPGEKMQNRMNFMRPAANDE